MTVPQERLVADLSSLAPDALASLVGDLWERRGWETEPPSKPGSDDAAQLLATRRSPVRRTHLLRAEGGRVGDREVREFAAAAPPERVNARVLVTSDSPQPETRELASDLDVEIVDGESLADLLVEHDAADLVDGTGGAGEVDHRDEELFADERRSDDVEILEASPFEELADCPLCNSGRNNGAYFYPGTGRRTIDGGRLWSADLWDRTDETATRNLRCDACATNWVETPGDGRESLWKLTSATRIRTGKREFVEHDDFPVASIDEWGRVDLDEGVLFPHPFDAPASAFETPPEPFDGWDACPNCSAAGTVFAASLDGESGRVLACRRCERSWTERRRLFRANRWRIDAADADRSNGGDAGDGSPREATLAEWEREAAGSATE